MPAVEPPEAPSAPTRRLSQSFELKDLVPLSISSVGPMFSVAATGGVMAAQAGWWTLPAIAVLAIAVLPARASATGGVRAGGANAGVGRRLAGRPTPARQSRRSAFSAGASELRCSTL